MGQLVPLNHAIVLFRHRLSGDSEEMLVTLGISLDSPRTVTDQVLVNALFDAWKAAMDTSFTTELTFVGAALHRQGVLGFVVTNSSTGTVTGTSSGASVPANVSVLIEKNTGRGGRSGRGRMYMPGFSEGGVSANGEIGTANLAQLNTDSTAAYNALFAVTDVDQLVLFHESTIGSPDPDDILSFTADPKVGTQRRRLR